MLTMRAAKPRAAPHDMPPSLDVSNMNARWVGGWLVGWYGGWLQELRSYPRLVSTDYN